MGVEEGEDMGHEYDGIRELNNPLPKWWTYLFVSTFVFAAVYLALFPGLGNFKGLLNWQSSDQTVRTLEESKEAIARAQENKQLNQYAKELDDADAYFGEAFRALAHNADGLRPIPEIAQDPEAIKVGQRLFLQNCSQCHGSDARGQTGFPNLTDNAWLYGGEPAAIVTTIMQGRIGQMPAWKDALGEQGVQEVVSYTLSLSGRKVNAREAEAGKARFVVCAACHGTDGKGNPAVGAPDLTDQYWLFGDSRAAVTETVMNGRSGVMPAWKDILGEDKVQLVAAYVWSLSNTDNK
jgi:cytochrome c oxidase cbb3-type subunit 3